MVLIRLLTLDSLRNCKSPNKMQKSKVPPLVLLPPWHHRSWVNDHMAWRQTFGHWESYTFRWFMEFTPMIRWLLFHSIRKSSQKNFSRSRTLQPSVVSHHQRNHMISSNTWSSFRLLNGLIGGSCQNILWSRGRMMKLTRGSSKKLK